MDNNNGTTVAPEVVEAMLPYFTEKYGNPLSLHDLGNEAREAVEEARAKVASLINGKPNEIIFTATGSESNNLAIRGLSAGLAAKGKHIIVSVIEHFSILQTAASLEKEGYQVTQIPVNKYGLVDPEEIKKAIRKDTILVSIMMANGEVGTIEPLAEISRITREQGVVFHTDAVAAVGNIPVNVVELGIDALSLAGNMFFGPKGSAALWFRKGLRLIPQTLGGVQEGGRRAGTENVPAIVGLGKAAQLAQQRLPQRTAKVLPLRDRLIKTLPEVIEHTVVTGHPQNRLTGHASFCVEFIEGESMLMLLNQFGIQISSGSSCTSRALKASHVLTALGLPTEIVQGSIIFGLSELNNAEDIELVIKNFPPIVSRLRSMSPLWAKYLKSKGVKPYASV